MSFRFLRPARGIACAAGASLPLLAVYACSTGGAAVPGQVMPGSDAAAGGDTVITPISDATTPPADTSVPDAPKPVDGPPPIDAANTFCGLPGSVLTMASGVYTMPGGPASAPSLAFLQIPIGFCVHYYATVPNARQLRFAPGGELFVSSPSSGTTGGGPGGLAAIQVVPDDDNDGFGDTQVTFVNGLPSTQGMLFAPGVFYYQNGVTIEQVAYTSGQRTTSGSPTTALTVNEPQSAGHWPKMIDMADDGTIYVTNGGDQGDVCESARPFRGGILRMDGTANGSQVAQGYRNPIALRCHKGFGAAACIAVELALDYSTPAGGREKLTPIIEGSDWGYPCCATANLPYAGVTYADTDGQTPDCTHVAAESNSFLISHTPFGLDFAPTSWPAPYGGNAFVTIHGAFSTWQGARLVAIRTSPMTGLPLPSAEDAGVSAGNQTDFAIGWDDLSKAHGRPAAITFSSDGRLFLSNDTNGTIVWIAPIGL